MGPITFYFPFSDEIDRLRSFDLGDWRVWSDPRCSRRRAWIGQTYLRLREVGHDVVLSAELPESGIVVVLPEPTIYRRFRADTGSKRGVFVLAIRADIVGYRPFIADAEIVQNGMFADEKAAFFIPHWPQPGIIPRDSSRGANVRVLAFKGRAGSLVEEFRNAAWQRDLASLGVEFRVDVPDNNSLPDWHDYSDVDLIIAVRTDFGDRRLRCEKPASKLVNAWHAGTPALLGPEYAYRELRRSDLDYVEVATAREAIDGIRRLKENPTTYAAMQENCRLRAREFSVDRIRDRWAEVLFDRVPELVRSRRYRFSRFVPYRARTIVNVATSPPSPYEFRRMIGAAVRRLG